MAEKQADGSSHAERETKRIIDSLDGVTDADAWASAFISIFDGRLQEIDEGLMIAWFAGAMQAAEHRCAGDGKTCARGRGVSAVFQLETGPPRYMTQLSGELHQRILLESGRLEGMARMIKLLGSGVDTAVLARELDEMAKRLRDDSPRAVHTPPNLEEIMGRAVADADARS